MTAIYAVHRRTFLGSAALLLFSGCARSVPHATSLTNSPDRAGAATLAATRLAKLEHDFGGRVGVFVLDTAGAAENTQLAYRADERFAFCSTFKLIVAGAVLARSVQQPALLEKRIHYGKPDLVTYSPVTEQHLTDGMTVAGLCAAALQYSDNTAANLLIGLLGGIQAVNAFAAAIGDSTFRLDRLETLLNSAVPGDPRDTSTPRAMAFALRQLALGTALPPLQRAQLCDWMRGNTTGAARIKAGIPSDWVIVDKTGTGDYEVANDIAVLWPSGRAPVVLAIYTVQSTKDAAPRSDVIAQAARVAVEWLG